jgi:methylglyoxal synthase
LASNDDVIANQRLMTVINQIYNLELNQDSERLDNFPFHFVFTGGTYDRLFYGDKKLNLAPLNQIVVNWLLNSCGLTRLKKTNEGGVIILSDLICQRKLSIVWPFFAPNANHWQRNENLALTRLCDQWHAKRLMNIGSVLAWYHTEFELDKNRNYQAVPLQLDIETIPDNIVHVPLDTPSQISNELLCRQTIPSPLVEQPKRFEEMTIALIAHDDMKPRMVEFAVDHEYELGQFCAILATGTTGREVAAATNRTIGNKMIRYHSGPKGGDIEIATAILYGHCDVVIFFVDPLSPHPHIDDIRVVVQACMVSDRVVMITNEMHAREFMTRAVRGKQQLKLYAI